MTTKRLAGLMLSMIFAGQAMAGPPLLTDDPGTPGPNHWEINLAVTSEKVGDEWAFETPLLDINYGIGERIQLKYEVPWIVIQDKNEGARNGLGNSTVGVKWRFLDQEKAWLDVSTYPQFEFNHGQSSVRKGLVEDGWSMLLPIEISHTFGPLTVYSEVGYAWNEKRPDEWLYGLAFQYEFSEKFSLMAEFYGNADHHFEQDILVSNLGFAWKFNEKVSLLMSIGRGVRGEEAPDFLSYLAVQFTL